MNLMASPYLEHLHSSNDLVTTYEAIRAGFVSLALEKNRRATPIITEARSLKEAASIARGPADLLRLKGIENALLTAAGLSDKALNHLKNEDKIAAINGLIKNFLEPAGPNFIEELVFRFLLVKGDSLGGSMRNIGGFLAQIKMTRFLISTLSIAGIQYQWKHSKTHSWVKMTEDDSEIEFSLRGLAWKKDKQARTLVYNLDVPFIKNNVDLCLFNLNPLELERIKYKSPQCYIALGELKGGIDPAGADEHWKTARTSLDRIRSAFQKLGYSPYTFFIGAAVEKKMAGEIWSQLESGNLTNAANLNEENQLTSLCRWLCTI